RFIRRQQTSDLIRSAEQFHREMDFVNQRQQHSAAEILAREVSLAKVLMRMPVFDPLTNLTLKQQRLSDNIVSKKLLQRLYGRMKLQIVSYKRNNAALFDLFEKRLDACKRSSQRLFDKDAAHVRQAALDSFEMQARGVTHDRYVRLELRQLRPIAELLNLKSRIEILAGSLP